MTTVKDLTHRRIDAIKKFVPPERSEQFIKLEAKYGRLLYLPLDIPLPALGADFVEWYNEASHPVQKIRQDVAGSVGGTYTFNSIDTRTAENAIWQTNVRTDTLTKFPAIQTCLDALPFAAGTEHHFSIWSSRVNVIPHRDEGPWFDMPCSFRIMLFDTNPSPTLILRENPVRAPSSYKPFFIPRVTGTTAFAWNNLRVLHASVHDPKYQKALLIVHNHDIDLDRYEDLMERSIAKYGQYALLSAHEQSDFSNI